MQSFLPLLALALAAFTSAAPAPAASSGCNSANPFLNRVQYANSRYASLLETTVASFTTKGDKLNAARVRTVQKTSTFIWIDDFAAIDDLKGHFDEAVRAQKKLGYGQKLIVPLVVYNLPDRDCSAKSSAGELVLAEGGEAKYRQFVDKVVATMKPYLSKLDFAVVVEPDSLGNSVTNLSVPKCAGAKDAYTRGVAYTVSKLGKFANVALYIDAAHSNWLGWPGNLEPTAKLMAEVVSMANGNVTNPANPAKIRGFATNVSNYNGYNSTTPDPIYGPGPDNPNWSELKYAKALTPFLEAEGLPAHFIIDQGRSGQQNIRAQGGHWCNIAVRPLPPLSPTPTTPPCTD